MTSKDLSIRDIHDPYYVYRVPGMMWPSEIGWMAQNFKNSNIHLEIGSYCGRSLVATARAMTPGSIIISVDPLSSNDAWINDVYNATKKFIAEKFCINIRHLDMTSVDAMRKIHDESIVFDSIFIDGCHHLAEVRSDIEGWLPFLRTGGLLSGHDYWPANAGVMSAVQETLADNFQVASNTRIWFSRKG